MFMIATTGDRRGIGGVKVPGDLVSSWFPQVTMAVLAKLPALTACVSH